MRKHPDTPILLIVLASLIVLVVAIVRLAGPGGPLDLSVAGPVGPRLAGR